jgi:RNA polymerase sigma-70 factor (ECF subfamily)
MPPTRPSLLVVAHLPTREGREALATLCGLYWYPLYAFVRRRNTAADEASDLTQGFFARLLEKNDLAGVDLKRGRFRSWLLTSMTHFLTNEWDRSRTQKRGGGEALVSIDAHDAEGRYLAVPSDGLTPEKLFQRQWLLAVLARVFLALERECGQSGKAALFEALKGGLAGDPGAPHSEVAAQLGMSEGAVRVAAHRLRLRHAELLRAEIAETVDRPEDVEDEIRSLLADFA